MKTKALLVIESICEHEMLRHEIDGIKLLKAIKDIYKFAHVSRNPSCVHKDWVDELNETYDAMCKDGIL